MIDIGNRIKLLREAANISGRSLAKMTGLDPSQISKIERGNSKPSLDALERICHALNITLSEFFSYDPDSLSHNESRLLVKEDKHYASKMNNLTHNQRQLLDTTKFLSPEQIKLLNEFLKSIKKDDGD